MQIISAVVRTMWWPDYPSRQVCLSSPLPASECLHRLRDVTRLRRRTSGYFGVPAPVDAGIGFEGSVAQESVQLLRSADARFFPAWLDARLDTADERGTVLAGTVGLSPRARRSRPFVFIPVGVINVGLLLAGLTLLAVPAQAPAVNLIALALVSSLNQAFFCWASRRAFERSANHLLRELRELLNSPQ